MSVSPVAGLRSIAIGVTNLDEAEKFYTEIWHLSVAARTLDAVYLRGTGPAHHILAIHRSDVADVRSVTFQVRQADDLKKIAIAVPNEGGELLSDITPVSEPGGGRAIIVKDPQGRILRFVYGDDKHGDVESRKDFPIRITHTVFNSADVAIAQSFYERALGFKLSDRTRIMAFMRCGADHHSIALADAEENTLNHIAFVMPDIDSVMRGGGRMRDSGYPIEWGVGRHGPGDNAFAYFIGPSNFVIEYTAEVMQVDDTYVVGGPDDWKWPPGRVDQWGISPPPSEKIKVAQKQIRFVGN
ncbi:VOC family protein [Herbaspirillum rhizosphaerae]|uniref:VOC family protein n=1 Tax=Herbaspirillum rhizosphaerae TaxID=346179 RepID=A0ABW8ZA05_9BURK